MYLNGLRAFFSRKAYRVTHHNAGNVKFARQPAEGAEVIPSVAFPFKSKDRLSRQAKFIGDGDTDPPGSDVQTKKPEWLVRL